MARETPGNTPKVITKHNHIKNKCFLILLKVDRYETSSIFICWFTYSNSVSVLANAASTSGFFIKSIYIKAQNINITADIAKYTTVDMNRPLLENEAKHIILAMLISNPATPFPIIIALIYLGGIIPANPNEDV